MAIIVVGGHSRNIGKTAVAAGLIAAFPELEWTAIKITQYGHGVCSINGRACSCAVDEHAYAILDEKNREGRTDTSRFLLAGARRALWLRTKQGQLALAMPELQAILTRDSFIIIESNTVLRFISPDLYLVVLRTDLEDFKHSAREFLDRADAAVILEPRLAVPVWKNISRTSLDRLPLFAATQMEFVSQALKDFVKTRLEISMG